MKQGFYVQLHLHTSETSLCGKSGGVEIARACKDAGYDLIFITDHFFNANIRDTTGLSWAESIDLLFAGYRAAKAEGDKIGLEVQKGWETCNDGPELLTYGLDERFLLANPDIADIGYDEYVQRVRAAGGYLIHAHPFRQAAYIIPFTPDPSIGAYEVFNGHNRDPEYNRLAYAEAARLGLMQFAGSDAHSVEGVQVGAMRFERLVHDIEAIFRAVKNGEAQIFEKLPECRYLY